MGGRYPEINQNGVSFLLADLDVALTFMDISETTHSEETAHRNHNNARKAYDTVLHLLERLVPSASEPYGPRSNGFNCEPIRRSHSDSRRRQVAPYNRAWERCDYQKRE
jgi:hypothetical protein